MPKTKIKKASKVKKNKPKFEKKITVKKRNISKKVAEAVDELEIDSEEDSAPPIIKKSDAYQEHACEYLNEAECEEDLDQDGLDTSDVEKSHFDEDKNEQ